MGDYAVTDNMEDPESIYDVPDVHATPTPLQPSSSDRVNHQNPMPASLRSNAQRDSDVTDKIRQFNNLSHLPSNHAAMSKQLERMTADAALKRAMIGREEAETEMRRYREESRVLRRQVEEGRERERKVGERLETIMESYGRAKETYSHTQTIWEKEIRRARKETMKTQSSLIKLQEELKSSRVACKSAEECLEREKELSKAREQEAFSARYQLVALQQELDKAQERMVFLEEERDAFKTAAKSEEVARIAAEGRLPLPPEDPDTEFASPRKRTSFQFQGRESLSTFEIVSSAATADEIEELTRLWQWEKQRADRTQDHLEFVQAENEMHRSQAQASLRQSEILSPRRIRAGPVEIVDPSDFAILGRDTEPIKSQSPASIKLVEPKVEEMPNVPAEPQVIEPPASDAEEPSEKPEKPAPKAPRRGTIFVPSEGIFRTISQQEMEAMEQDEVEDDVNNDDDKENNAGSPLHPVLPTEVPLDPPRYARTPSVEPPSFALMAQERTSLLSLLNAPRDSEVANYAYKAQMQMHSAVEVENFSTGDAGDETVVPEMTHEHEHEHGSSESALETEEEEQEVGADEEQEEEDNEDQQERDEENPAAAAAAYAPSSSTRPHTSAAFYTVTTTTTKVPMKDENEDPVKPHSVPLTKQKYHQGGNRTPSFDVNNPALTPTMTREQALAQIRERRGRARSAMQGNMTPRRQMVVGGVDRNVSAPAGAGRTNTATGTGVSSAAKARS
ncbi:hypothetical protein F4777DRAFT_436047 [Nemania sp. FL0916]|nr:hypothetical protein F4777DRAFT_436047 [Nemania sp. FL0916]